MHVFKFAFYCFLLVLYSCLWVLVFVLHRVMGRPGNPYCSVEEERRVIEEPVTDHGVIEVGRSDFWSEQQAFLKLFIHKIYLKLISLSSKFYHSQNPALDQSPMSGVYIR